MSLSLRQKERFYRSFGQLLKSGITFPTALEKMAHTTRGGEVRRLIDGLQVSSREGLTVAESFAAQRSLVTDLEVSTIGAVERSGKLDRGLTQIAEHFGAMAQAREVVIKKSAYPAFVLHFGIIALSLPKAISGGLPVFLRETGIIFGCVYSTVILIALIVPLLRDEGAKFASIDAVLRKIPLIGKIRSSFALARFCSTYEMQLDAGVNVLDALLAAARTSRSGLIISAVKNALPELRGGVQPGPLLAGSGAFPDDTIRAICVGEDTGELDSELRRLAAEHQREGISRLETLAEWLPKLVYIGILIYLGWGVVKFFKGYYGQVDELMKGF